MSQSQKSLSKDNKEAEGKKNDSKYQTINSNYCKGSKFYFDPQLLSKRKVGINNSTSKQMYQFGKEHRFRSFKKPWDAFFYNLPSMKDRFTTTFGFGRKFDFTKNVMKNLLFERQSWPS